MLTALHNALKLTVIVVSHDIRTVAAGCDRIACLSRTLHSHVSPEGLTPKVLAEVFRHDVAGIFGDLHVDAHAAASCTNPAHAAPPVGLSVSAQRKADQ
jgi:ABC-type Mn2+/Zn2+ transport system ATPase subunit